MLTWLVGGRTVPGTADGPAEKHPPSSSSTAKASGRAPARVPGRGRGRPRKTPAASTSAPASDVPVEGASDEEPVAISYWLMKAEPESRMHNGVDVKFSIDDLRAASEPEAWDGKRLVNFLLSGLRSAFANGNWLGVRNSVGRCFYP